MTDKPKIYVFTEEELRSYLENEVWESLENDEGEWVYRGFTINTDKAIKGADRFSEPPIELPESLDEVEAIPFENGAINKTCGCFTDDDGAPHSCDLHWHQGKFVGDFQQTPDLPGETHPRE